MRTYSISAASLAVSFVLGQALVPAPAFAQSVISARSGLINYFEGVAFLDGQPLEKKAGLFSRMKEGSTLLTEAGRAEVLLTPDAYLRIGENSSIRMLSNSISDTQVEVLSGSAILDNSKAAAGDFVKLVFRDSTVRVLKPGHYRVDAEPPQLRVYAGEAEVAKNAGVLGSGSGIPENSKPVKIEASQLFPLDGAPVVRRFTQGSDGLLDLWSDERDSLISSNIVNSQTISDPLLDNGPDVPADLAAYIGYVPMATIPPGAPGVASPSYGYGYGYGYGLGFPTLYPGMPVGFYPGLAISTFVPLNSGMYGRGLYGPGRYSYGASTFTTRPIYGATGVRTISPPRSVFTPRAPTPVIAPRVGGVGGVHGVGGIHAVGHR